MFGSSLCLGAFEDGLSEGVRVGELLNWMLRNLSIFLMSATVLTTLFDVKIVLNLLMWLMASSCTAWARSGWILMNSRTIAFSPLTSGITFNVKSALVQASGLGGSLF